MLGANEYASDDCWCDDEPTQRTSATQRPRGTSDCHRTSLRWAVESVLYQLDQRPLRGGAHQAAYGLTVHYEPSGIEYSAYATWRDDHGRMRTVTLMDDHGNPALYKTLEAAWGALAWRLEEALLDREYERRAIERERELAKSRTFWARLWSRLVEAAC